MTLRKFNYTDLAWASLKEKFLASENDLNAFSYEENGSAFPRMGDLEKRANREKWEYLRGLYQAKQGKDVDEISSNLVAKKLEKIESITDKLAHVYSTIQLTQRMQSELELVFPKIQEALRLANWNKLQHRPDELVKAFKTLVESYKTLNTLQAQYLGLTNTQAVADVLEQSTRFDSTQSLNDIQVELQQMEDQDLASVIQEFLN